MHLVLTHVFIPTTTTATATATTTARALSELCSRFLNCPIRATVHGVHAAELHILGGGARYGRSGGLAPLPGERGLPAALLGAGVKMAGIMGFTDAVLRWLLDFETQNAWHQPV